MVNPRSSEKAQRVVNEKAQQVFNKEDSPIDIINTARDQNFTDAAIRDYLTRVRKFGKREIDRLLKVHDDTLKTMPASLGNIVGGMKAGIKLYEKIAKKYYSLQKKNIKAKVKKSQEDIMDETMDFLRSQPEYKKLLEKGDAGISTKQSLMVIDMARALGGKQSTNLNAVIRNARIILQAKTKGQKELKKIQRELRNFMRKTLPKDIYTKSEALKLMRKIEQATQDNISELMNEVMEFAATKNNTRLEKAIDKLLNGKYEVKVNGILKGIKIDEGTRKRLKALVNRINPKKGLKTEDAVIKYLAELETEYNEILEKPIKSEGDYTSMVDLQIVINMVNATKKNNSKKLI